MTRDEFVAQMVSGDMFGLEVGPGYAPAFPRSKGWNVETLDHATADELREKYRGMIDVSCVEHIDYVSDGGLMHETIARRGEYDFIYASHVIEHVTDPVAFFRSCEILLKDTGNLILVVPDKRHCFDALQPVTTTGDFLDAFNAKATRHSAGRAFDFVANTTGLGSHGIWESHWTGEFNLPNSFEQAQEIYNRASSSLGYVDIHAWRFTPSSFRLIMQDMNHLGLVNLRESLLIPSMGMEFYFSASVTALGCATGRLELHKDILREQIEGFQQIVQA